MKIQKNKKALSGAVSTVLIITCAIIAVLILAAAVKEISENILTSPEFNCIDLEIKPPVEIVNTCYNAENQDLNIEIEKTISNLEIKSLEFLISTAQTTETFFCSESCSDCKIIQNGRKTYYLNSDEKPTKVTLKVNGCVLETTEVINDC